MKNSVYFLFPVALMIASCASDTGSGALIGAGGGALAGGLIGGGATGALIGAGVGAAAGGLISYSLDQQDRDNLQKNSPETLEKIDQSHQLSVDDIKNMSKNGLNDDVIINQIQSTHSVFYLSTNDIIDLKRAGVSQKVIDYMIQTGNSS